MSRGAKEKIERDVYLADSHWLIGTTETPSPSIFFFFNGVFVRFSTIC
jgi:hypothetical protein